MPVMQGLDVKGMRRHPALIPLYGCLLLGGSAVAYFTGRCAATNPDVTWSQKRNPEPWQEYSNKRYQLLDPASKRGWTENLPRPNSIWD